MTVEVAEVNAYAVMRPQDRVQVSEVTAYAIMRPENRVQVVEINAYAVMRSTANNRRRGSGYIT